MIASTITEDIQNGYSSEIGHRRFNNALTIHYGQSGETIQTPINSIIAKYIDYFTPIIREYTFTEEERATYRFAPKKFCQDEYGNQGYWSMILYINECHSVLDFDLETIKYFEPTRFRELLEEVLITDQMD